MTTFLARLNSSAKCDAQMELVFGLQRMHVSDLGNYHSRSAHSKIVIDWVYNLYVKICSHLQHIACSVFPG
jgi:hypothetical protein